ncbi:unnamed protein product [Echinostoma caproni]|uniref:Dynein_attach_N domain-containing protein n=1 Tax=Echinostoma caproni TaxID=27848 RepID=A0A183A6F8_9TREM|nr:unnamed protein product [Echinostoma caproni]
MSYSWCNRSGDISYCEDTSDFDHRMSPETRDDDFGEFQTSKQTEVNTTSTKTNVISSQTKKTVPIASRPNYNVSVDPSSELTPLESVQHEWLRCVVQCAELMRDSLDALEPLTSHVDRAEFNDTEEGSEFLYDILEVYLVANRIRGSAERLALLHAPLQARFSEIQTSMSKLFQYIVKDEIKATEDETKLSVLDGGSSQIDRNAKLCEALERKIDALVQTNRQLAGQTAFLSSSLICILDELDRISAEKESESSETQLTNKVRRQLIRMGFLPPVAQLPNAANSSIVLKRPASPMHELVTKKAPLIEDNKQSTEASMPSGGVKLSNKHLLKTENSGKFAESVEFKDEEPDDYDDSDADSETIRAAFRLFAKQIGPALKREHRQRFGTAPTQSWLADQLLARWDALDRRERRIWHQVILHKFGKDCIVPQTSYLMNSSNENHLARLGINVNRLESEMNAAVARDTRYWLENDAKIRAVEQRVPTYEHFRQLVAGCHLCPLDKSELNDLAKSKTSWNPAIGTGCHVRSSVPSNDPEQGANETVQTPQHFYARWQSLSLSRIDEQEKVSQLAILVFQQPKSVLREVFDCGLGATLLPEVLSVFNRLIKAESTDTDLNNQLTGNIFNALVAFVESKQFPLAVDLCSDEEKRVALSVLSHLSQNLSCGTQNTGDTLHALNAHFT